eukprot:scaffold2085_cov263-Pinguiococcus_pyrenoidosus.AAC.4
MGLGNARSRSHAKKVAAHLQQESFGRLLDLVAKGLVMAPELRLDRLVGAAEHGAKGFDL